MSLLHGRAQLGTAVTDPAVAVAILVLLLLFLLLLLYLLLLQLVWFSAPLAAFCAVTLVHWHSAFVSDYSLAQGYMLRFRTSKRG